MSCLPKCHLACPVVPQACAAGRRPQVDNCTPRHTGTCGFANIGNMLTIGLGQDVASSGAAVAPAVAAQDHLCTVVVVVPPYRIVRCRVARNLACFAPGHLFVIEVFFMKAVKTWFARACMVAGVVATGVAHAAYPEKPVNVVVGFAPGGTNDIVARFISAGLEKHLGKPFVVVNK